MLLVGLAVGVGLLAVPTCGASGRGPADATCHRVRIAGATSGRSVSRLRDDRGGGHVRDVPTQMLTEGSRPPPSWSCSSPSPALVTVPPMMLSLLGDRVDLGRIPAGQDASPLHREPLRHGLAALKRPAVSVVAGHGPPARAGDPAGHAHRAPGWTSCPADTSIMQSYHHITAASWRADTGACSSPRPHVRSSEMNSAVEDFQARAIATDWCRSRLVRPPRRRRRRGRGAASPATAPDATSVRASTRWCDDVVPATFGKVPGAEAYVGGNRVLTGLQRPAAARDGPVVLFVPSWPSC